MTCPMPTQRSLFPLLGAVAMLASGCSLLQSPNTPDLLYSEDAASARNLQIPPDLTRISDAEQFILPGTGGGPITRNTLLPGADGARFVRSEAGSWLALSADPESVWPRLIDFLRSDGFVIAETLPATGTVATRWSDGESRGVLGGLLRSDERERLAFRLERDGRGTRLFARRQVADAGALESAPDWPAASNDPERTSELLTRFLVFIGLSEQQSRGVITTSQASDVLQPAALRTTVAGSQLVVHRGFRTAFDDLSTAIETSGRRIAQRDGANGRIVFSAVAGADTAAPSVVLSVVPVHISAVRVMLTDANGQRLPNDDEQAVLSSLLEHFV